MKDKLIKNENVSSKKFKYLEILIILNKIYCIIRFMFWFNKYLIFLYFSLFYQCLLTGENTQSREQEPLTDNNDEEDGGHHLALYEVCQFSYILKIYFHNSLDILWMVFLKLIQIISFCGYYNISANTFYSLQDFMKDT